MRRALLVLALAAALAGCFGDDESTPTPPTTTTPAATSPEPTPTSPVVTSPEPTPTTPTPEPVAPKTLANVTFDFASEGDATGQSPKTRQTDAVPAGYANVTANVTLVRSGTAPTALPGSVTVNSPTVRILDAKGAEVLVASKEGETVAVTLPAVPGQYTLRFEGAGTMKATVLVVAHA